METIPFQPTFRPELPVVLNNVDYQEKECLLKRIDEILTQGKIDWLFIKLSVEEWVHQTAGGCIDKIRAKDLAYRQRQTVWAFRAMILKSLFGYDYRELSCQLAQCPLYRWFCQMEELGPIKVAGKSTLQEWGQRLPVDRMNEVIAEITRLAADSKHGDIGQVLELKNSVELDVVWADSTCLKANIHFPVDWVLLGDAVGTLVGAVTLIREHGLQHRMAPPQKFSKQMNHLAMEMCAVSRQEDGKKKRKRVLRKMKKVTNVVRKHALRHRDLLEKDWEKTDLTRKEVDQVLGRIDNILLLLPDAIHQAHERIIGERLVDNEKKILSLFEPDIHVIVRGKAGGQVEFGNTLLLVEQADGLIVDWHLFKERAPTDSGILIQSVERIEGHFGAGIVEAVVADRGFASKANDKWLEERGIYSGLCPRNPKSLEAKKHSAKFVRMQKRRAQTEGRIAIFKNNFAGKPMRSKGFEHREMELSWHVLAHNLWVVARLEKADAVEEALPEAA